MTRFLIIAASLGFAVSGAAACDFLHSASNVDETKVASVTTDEAQKMSTPAAPTTTETMLIIVREQSPQTPPPAETE
jgi:hypothetical protein